MSKPPIHKTKKPLSKKALLLALRRRARQQKIRLRMVRLGTMAMALLSSVLLFFGLGFLLSPPNIDVPSASSSHPFIIRTPKIPPPPKDMIILLMGVDINPEGQSEKDAFWGVRTDTIMLARVRPETQEVSIVSIPRDSKVFLTQSGRVGKINSAFSMGGAKQAIRVVERSFGIPIDRYAVINLQGIQDVLEALGGVDVFIEKAMSYNDHSGDLHINFKPGKQHLNGQQAMEYLRFRHDALGDIGRIRRQQKLMGALTKKFNDPWIVTKIPRLIEVAQPHIQTDLSLDEMLSLGWFGRALQRSAVHVSTLPGGTSIEDSSYWLINQRQARTLLNKTMLGTPKKATKALASNSKNNSSEALLPNKPLKKPIPIGILYPSHLEESVNKLSLIIEDLGFTVICQQAQEELSTEILEHNTNISAETIQRLKQADSSLSNAAHVIAPIGGTFEHLYCSSREDITLTLGNDLG